MNQINSFIPLNPEMKTAKSYRKMFLKR